MILRCQITIYDDNKESLNRVKNMFENKSSLNVCRGLDTIMASYTIDWKSGTHLAWFPNHINLQYLLCDHDFLVDSQTLLKYYLTIGKQL